MPYDSTNVTVFPSVKKGVKESYELSEKNIVGLINKILDNNSTFAISESISASSDFELMISGYYFKIPQSEVSAILTQFASSSNIYAHIALTSGDYVELTIDGLQLSDSDPSVPASYLKIKIAEKVNGSWQVPRASILKYRGERLSGVIDGNLS